MRDADASSHPLRLNKWAERVVVAFGWAITTVAGAVGFVLLVGGTIIVTFRALRVVLDLFP